MSEGIKRSLQSVSGSNTTTSTSSLTPSTHAQNTENTAAEATGLPQPLPQPAQQRPRTVVENTVAIAENTVAVAKTLPTVAKNNSKCSMKHCPQPLQKKHIPQQHLQETLVTRKKTHNLFCHPPPPFYGSNTCSYAKVK